MQIKQIRPHDNTNPPTPIDLPFLQNKSSRFGRSGVEAVFDTSGSAGKEGNEDAFCAFGDAGSGGDSRGEVPSFNKSDKSGMEGTAEV
jgi:hypothetical protein